ncbi:MAG: hypothetical protein AAF193_00760, partial [Bacteroidota bacterium]
SILESGYPKEAGVFMLKGDILLDVQATNEAFAAYQRSVELDPGQLEVWSWLLDAYIGEQKWEEGLLTANEALELYPSYPALYLQKSYMHMGMDQYTEAIAALKMGEVLVFDDPFLQAQMNGELGRAYHMIEDYVNSDKHFAIAIKKDGNNAYLLNNYAYYLSEREDQLEQAAELSSKSNSLQPGTATFEDTRGWIFYKKGEYDQAKTWLEKAVQNSNEEDGVILEHYGDTLFQLGMKDQALEFWKKAQATGGASHLIDLKVADGQLHE